MGVSLISAIEIKSCGDEIICGHGEQENGKYSGMIARVIGDEYKKLILSSGPIYDSTQEAIGAMESVVKEIRECDNIWK